MNGIVIGAILLMIAVYLVIILLGLVNYIIKSYSIYVLASRRKISKAWLAWIPIASCWTVGSLADDYDLQHGIKRKWRVVLLTLNIVMWMFVVAFYVFAIGWTITNTYATLNPAAVPSQSLIIFLVAFYIGLFLVALAGTVLNACQTICVYKIFESTVPEKSVKYMILYLLIPIVGSVCLYRCRNKGYEAEESEAECYISAAEETVTTESDNY